MNIYYIGTRKEAYCALQEEVFVSSACVVEGSQVHQYLVAQELPHRTVCKANKQQIFSYLAALSDHVVFSVGFPFILPNEVLATDNLFVNSHPAILPAWPGAKAITVAFAAGDMEMGVTVHEMVEEVDTGPIIHQECVNVEGMPLSEIYTLLFSEVEPQAIQTALTKL